MRWDRLFADLEGEAAELVKVETDALAADLTDEVWEQTSWRDLIGGQVSLDVHGAGQVSGVVASTNATLIRMWAETIDLLVATNAVVEVVAAERRADPPSRIEANLGWSSALRRLRDADEMVRVTVKDGRVHQGFIDAVGQDFVRLETESGRRRIVVLDKIAVVAPAL